MRSLFTDIVIYGDYFIVVSWLLQPCTSNSFASATITPSSIITIVRGVELVQNLINLYWGIKDKSILNEAQDAF
jgi:hypothetical protein